MKLSACSLSSAFALAAVSASAQLHINYPNLGVVTGTARAFGVSGDGTTAVGHASAVNDNLTTSLHAIRWTSAGTANLGTFDGRFQSSAFGVSFDGSVVVGQSDWDPAGTRNEPEHAFVWTAGGGMQDIGTLSGGVATIANAVSGDGSVVVGSGDAPGSASRAFRWTSGGGTVDLGAFSGGTQAGANGANFNGSVIGGWSETASGQRHAAVWMGGTLLDFGTLSGGTASAINAVSRDGTVLVGTSGSSAGQHAVRWRSGGSMQDLGTIPTWGPTSVAYATSGNGEVVGGAVVGTGGTDLRAFVWTQAGGMINLTDYVSANGVDLSGNFLTRVTGISDNGSVMSGIGRSSLNGREFGWILTGMPVPEPATFLILGLPALALARRRGARRV